MRRAGIRPGGDYFREAPPQASEDSMQELFKAAVERGASDIHIKAGDFMRARVHGDLQPLTQQKLTPSSR
jgi:Tfp pilus assembly pilus retraction ATPase PilT